MEGGCLSRFYLRMEWFLYDVAFIMSIIMSMQYNAKNEQDVKSLCRVLFTGLGVNSGV